MQRLDPAVQTLGESGHGLNRGDRDTSRPDRRRRPAGGHDFDTALMQLAGQLVKPGLVKDDDERPGNSYPARCRGGHRRDPPDPPSLTVRPVTDQPSESIAATVSASRARSADLIRSVRVSSSSSSCTRTACCAMTGPLSRPESTRKTVHPVTLTPYASASRTPCIPGNDGSRAGWELMHRPANSSRNCGPNSFMNPAEITRSGSYPAQASVRALSQSARLP